MGYIVHLPKSVIGHLRSSSILSDLSQAVEELICNSLDAGAKKIRVSVDLASFYIKVEDDGSGVTRDDLSLIGERHATSKLHDMVDLESGIKTLGFRGEALSSLSDMCILEIITRVRGSPNTYKKILKGSKKLSLGLYGEQRAPGTTVVLRELFYNLPVRRKVALSSPRKVLQGVKDCTIRLALIHPDVSFTVIDLERQENLVCTNSHLSSLDTLCEFFGEHLRHKLQELCYAEKSLKLDGFISRETSQFSSKAIQFLYLNGRFVHKTPVHKLINTTFWRINCGHALGNSLEAGMLSASLKQVYPMFLLNLHCPLSYYDITLEATKSSVEFKDWKSILLFVTEALGMSWSRLTWNLDEGAERYLKKSNLMDFKKLTPHKRKPWQHVDPTYRPRCSISIPKAEDNYCGLVGRLQNAEENDQGEQVMQELTFATPKRARGPRKRRAYESTHEELMSRDLSTSPWSLQPCSIRRKMEADDREDKNQGRHGWREDMWCGEESFQWNERSGMLSLHNDSFEGIVGQDDVSGKELLCQNEPSLILANVSRINTSGPSMELDSYPRLRELSFDGQVDQFESVTREHLSGFDEAISGMAECAQTSPWLRRSFSFCTPKVRRCLYDLDLKSSCMNDFLCHSERQTVSNLEIKSVSVDMEELWTSKQDTSTIDFPVHSFHRDFQEEFEQECHQNDLLSLKNKHRLLEHNSFLSPPGKERGVYDFSLTLSTHAGNRGCTFDKGSKNSKRQLLKQTAGLQRKEMDVFSFLPTPTTDVLHENPSMHVANIVAPFETIPLMLVANQDAVLNKGCKEKPLKQSTAVEKSLDGPPNTCLRRTLSGPPFYRPPLKHAASDGMSTLDCFRECMDGCEFLKGGKLFDKRAWGFSHTENFQKGKQFAKSLKDRHQSLTVAAAGSVFSLDNRGLQEKAKLQLKDSQSMPPSKRIGADGIKTKWRDTECGDMVAEDGVAETALQLYKDWKNPCIRSVEPNILDLSSGVLGPTNKHLFPDSISKEGLQKAQVLRQMDKKFIAVVAEQTLVMIDQHAADERVRLEQFRKEVFEEKQQLSTLLDYPQELSISLGEQQLLCTYKVQIEEWGWHFKILGEQRNNNGERFGRAHHGNTTALLTGVPNILGESLSNAKYLSEYLCQLASTDGTSTPPPAVLRVLASKACRGAIMFGDYLLRSECQQLVEGLKKTALSFQCAHGRPTLVPIVNLEALHTRLGKQHCRKRLEGNIDGMASTGARNAWHGLQWHRSTVKRATERLKRAEEMM